VARAHQVVRGREGVRTSRPYAAPELEREMGAARVVLARHLAGRRQPMKRGLLGPYVRVLIQEALEQPVVFVTP